MPASPKPTILVVTSTLPRWRGDSEPRFVLDLCRALSDEFQITLLAPHCCGAAATEVIEGVAVRRFRYFPAWGEVLAYEGGMLPKLRLRPWLWLLVPFFMAGLIVAVVRSLRGEPMALVHAHWLIPQGFCVRLAMWLARRHPPLICTTHGSDVLGLRSAVAQHLQRWVAQGCARVGAVSGALRDELVRRGVPAGKIQLMPMGVTVPSAQPDPARRQSQLIAFAGRIIETKGVDILLQAFHRIASELPDARLCVAGGGPELTRYRRLAATLGLADRASFLGPVPQERVWHLFARAAVAVMPSVTGRDGASEGFPLVMLEAMAAACPLIVSDLAAVRGVIRPRENGLVFPEGDEKALAEAILDLLRNRDLALRLAAAGYRDVQARYSWAAVAMNHRAIYAQAMGSHDE